MALRRRGILITNLGTPAAPTRAAVKEYLSEFLMDPHVITLPGPLRYLVAPIRQPPMQRFGLQQEVRYETMRSCLRNACGKQRRFLLKSACVTASRVSYKHVNC
ncbi:MAG: ferrochelatase [Pseudomonadales bacterium]|nr:ferrochelatase [Pseudomonadales bacterium]